MLSKLPPIATFEPEPAPVLRVEDFDDHSVTVRNVNGVYVVEADWLLQVMRGINFDDYESLSYFQKVLDNGGVIEALRQKGAEDGDTVSIYDVEFDFGAVCFKAHASFERKRGRRVQARQERGAEIHRQKRHRCRVSQRDGA